MSEEPKYTEGICGDGAAILKDGERMTISEIIAELNTRPDSKPYRWEDVDDWVRSMLSYSEIRATFITAFNAGRERKEG